MRYGRNTPETGHGLEALTAYPRFDRVVSRRELAESFAPAGDGIKWARARTDQDERHLLALAAWHARNGARRS